MSITTRPENLPEGTNLPTEGKSVEELNMGLGY